MIYKDYDSFWRNDLLIIIILIKNIIIVQEKTKYIKNM